MKRKCFKLTSLFLAMLMVLSITVLPVSAVAADDYPTDQVEHLCSDPYCDDTFDDSDILQLLDEEENILCFLLGCDRSDWYLERTYYNKQMTTHAFVRVERQKCNRCGDIMNEREVWGPHTSHTWRTLSDGRLQCTVCAYILQ